MSGPPVILFHVQHLLGVGHAHRAARICRALAESGTRIVLAWGGTRQPSVDLSGVEVEWLTPLKARDADIRELVTENGESPPQSLLDERRDYLLALFERLRPDLVATETFPFGRRLLRFELEPLMKRARSAEWCPATACSIRDIMPSARAPKRVAESLEAARKWYDLILVHGDPSLAPIEETLQGAEELESMIRYTGLVAGESPRAKGTRAEGDRTTRADGASVGDAGAGGDTPTRAAGDAGAGGADAGCDSAEVVVSVGGGATGASLLRVACESFRYSERFPRGWLLLAGSEIPESDLLALRNRVRREATPQEVRVERSVPDLASLLSRSKVSVSRAGYNTACDLARSGARCVLVPFEGGRETEQLHRAEILARRGIALALRENELTPQSLARAVDQAFGLPRFLLPERLLDGARRSARILNEAALSARENRA